MSFNPRHTAVPILILMFVFSAYYSKAEDKTTTTKAGTVWKIELEKPNLVQNGVKRQIYYLILFIDGTYMQQIYIEPENKENFMGVTYFELEGKWTSNDKELILEEQGEKRTIDYETFYSKFENVDNIIYTPPTKTKK
ncbi:MAG: hypothetical protein H6553_03300 [Chitinophagales bacterium]|nr:hypothetical protein [Chitinophagales bacterium]